MYTPAYSIAKTGSRQSSLASAARARYIYVCKQQQQQQQQGTPRTHKTVHIRATRIRGIPQLATAYSILHHIPPLADTIPSLLRTTCVIYV